MNSPKSSGTQKPTKKTVLDINFKRGREKSRRCYSTLHEIEDCVCGSNYIKTKGKKRKYSHNNPELKSVADVNTMGFGETKDTKGCEGRER